MTWDMERWYLKNIHTPLAKRGVDQSMLNTMREAFDFASLQKLYAELQAAVDIRERRKARHKVKEVLGKVMASAGKRHRMAGRDLSGMPGIVDGARKRILVILEPRGGAS